ncbi:MAG: type II secretion system F family protein [Deltaproteobacteria bacterium]|nr:type II secretion system F family protein [Deltaproteobacteria bacterium]
MPVYAWEGKTKSGEVRKGTLEAPNEAVVTAQLRAQKIAPTRIKKSMGAMSLKIPGFKRKVSTKDVVIFTRQFATMIDAGLPLVQCLDILSTQQENPTFKEILLKVKEDVEAGNTFADALAKHPSVFDRLFVNLVAAGEVGGILDTILNRLAAYIEKAMNLKKKVKGAMVYPATVVAVAVLVVAIILIFVIPVFQSMFAGAGKALPAPTLFVIALSNFTKKYFLLIAIVLFLIVAGLKRVYRTDKGRASFDRLFLKLPILGPLIRKVSVAKFTRTLGTLISSGVPILEGLDVVAKTAGNYVVEQAIIKTRESISEGRTIAEPLKETKVFPPMVVQMIAVGEATGALDQMLSKIADFYDTEVDEAVGALTAAIEPLLMVFLGGAIGGLVVSMYLPVFQMAGTVSGG